MRATTPTAVFEEARHRPPDSMEGSLPRIKLVHRSAPKEQRNCRSANETELKLMIVGQGRSQWTTWWSRNVRTTAPGKQGDPGPGHARPPASPLAAWRAWMGRDGPLTRRPR
jgi:hypothetical protein